MLRESASVTHYQQTEELTSTSTGWSFSSSTCSLQTQTMLTPVSDYQIFKTSYFSTSSFSWVYILLSSLKSNGNGPSRLYLHKACVADFHLHPFHPSVFDLDLESSYIWTLVSPQLKDYLTTGKRLFIVFSAHINTSNIRSQDVAKDCQSASWSWFAQFEDAWHACDFIRSKNRFFRLEKFYLLFTFNVMQRTAVVVGDIFL